MSERDSKRKKYIDLTDFFPASSSPTSTSTVTSSMPSPIPSSSNAALPSSLVSSSSSPSYPFSGHYKAFRAKFEKDRLTLDPTGPLIPFCDVLWQCELDWIKTKGMEYVGKRAQSIIKHALGKDKPWNDGKQTPYHGKNKDYGNPVFVAQHATRTCCRSCIQHYHGIEKGIALTDAQIECLANIVIQWIQHHSTVSCEPTSCSSSSSKSTETGKKRKLTDTVSNGPDFKEQTHQML